MRWHELLKVIELIFCSVIVDTTPRFVVTIVTIECILKQLYHLSDDMNGYIYIYINYIYILYILERNSGGA